MDLYADCVSSGDEEEIWRPRRLDALMGAIGLMPVFGVTFNLISLFGFILVLGIVVDDAIVTGENIYQHFSIQPDSETAAIMGAKEVALPVIFGVLTTDTIEQALERAGTKAGNKGWDAALSALEMADLYRRLG